MSFSKNTFSTSKVASISAAHHIHDIYTSFLAPILPLLMEKYGINYSMAGLLNVIQRIPSLFNPFVGMIADKMSVRYFIIITPALTAISMSLIGLASSYIFAAILLFISGISSTLFHVPAPVMIKHVAGNKIGKGMSFYMLGGELARTLGPVIILGAISLWGLEGSYKLIPLGVFTSVILYYKFKDISIRHDFKSKKEEKARETYGLSLKRFMPVLITTTSIVLFRGGMKSALTLYLPTYINEAGNSLWFAGISLSILQLAGAAGTLLSGTLSDKIGRKNLFIISAIGAPVLMLFFMLSSGIATIPLLILLGIFIFAPGPVMLAAVHDKKTQNGAFINGVYMGMNFFINSLNVLAIGWLADRIGLKTTFILSIAWALLVIPFVLRFKETHTQR
jgi:FSR family fosmidomycin resistance protein-like MFS transporter